MAICRVHKTEGYTVMSNCHLRDMNLSLKAKGLLSMVFSLPENWDYSIKGLAQICVEAEKAVTSALNELKQYGYLVIERGRSEDGRLFAYEYHFYETPADCPGFNKGSDNPQGGDGGTNGSADGSSGKNKSDGKSAVKTGGAKGKPGTSKCAKDDVNPDKSEPVKNQSQDVKKESVGSNNSASVISKNEAKNDTQKNLGQDPHFVGIHNVGIQNGGTNQLKNNKNKEELIKESIHPINSSTNTSLGKPNNSKKVFPMTDGRMKIIRSLLSKLDNEVYCYVQSRPNYIGKSLGVPTLNRFIKYCETIANYGEFKIGDRVLPAEVILCAFKFFCNDFDFRKVFVIIQLVDDMAAAGAVQNKFSYIISSLYRKCEENGHNGFGDESRCYINPKTPETEANYGTKEYWDW